jgi:hypothetical protein
VSVSSRKLAEKILSPGGPANPSDQHTDHLAGGLPREAQLVLLYYQYFVLRLCAGFEMDCARQWLKGAKASVVPSADPLATNSLLRDLQHTYEYILWE